MLPLTMLVGFSAVIGVCLGEIFGLFGTVYFLHGSKFLFQEYPFYLTQLVINLTAILFGCRLARLFVKRITSRLSFLVGAFIIAIFFILAVTLFFNLPSSGIYYEEVTRAQSLTFYFFYVVGPPMVSILILGYLVLEFTRILESRIHNEHRSSFATT